MSGPTPQISAADAQKAQQQMEQQAKQEEQIDGMLRGCLSAEARDRLKRIEVVKPERAREVEIQILNAVRAGRLQPPVSDDIVREMLTNISGQGSGSSQKITVLRKVQDGDDW